MSPLPPYYVESLARGLSVIAAFDGIKQRMSVSDISAATGLSRAAVRRLLLTLVDLGYAGREGSCYWLTPRVLGLGYAYLSTMPLADRIEAHMRRASETIGESCSAAVLDENEVVYVARAEVRRMLAVRIAIGAHLPAYCNSMGRVMLAGFPDAQLDGYLERLEPRAYTDCTIVDKVRLREAIVAVRAAGYCLIEREYSPESRSLAVPVRSRDGTVVLSINVTVHADLVSGEDLLARALPTLRTTAAAVEAEWV